MVEILDRVQLPGCSQALTAILLLPNSPAGELLDRLIPLECLEVIIILIAGTTTPPRKVTPRTNPRSTGDSGISSRSLNPWLTENPSDSPAGYTSISV